ncbi:hypothetical protein BT96DRAFT_967598 [Gymnopus androsaceus JB14]|uniref:FAD-binding FR-type domain-containing protein n=1 Tax=Gymnopus androsaceus JB14 TaxID=1447944 RepID=A0A6A4H210_9AGAR|nr:hypothetical protein BT96DRAFT_967598 [Gymnopus androsaceus JB14]
MSFGTAPTVPTALQVYNSYLIDPEWQTKFSIIWASCLGAAIVFASPYLLKSIRNGRAFAGFFGISEDFEGRGKYESVDRTRKKTSKRSPTIRRIEGVLSVIRSVGLWSPPGLSLNFGQLFVVLAYLIIVLICIIMGSQLVSNSNRAGFMALAQLPVVFLFGTKNSIVSLLLGPGNGYEKLNYIHRWSGRTLFLGAVVHGSLWIRNHLQYNIQIIGAQKETSGVAALGVLSGIVLTSFKPVRRLFWDFFWVVHVLGYVAFFITICYHSIYAIPWIFPPLAFYAADIFMRMIRVRIKDAGLTAVDSNMTVIRVSDCDSNWIAGQHVRLRVFFSGRVLESHPLTIMNAPSDITCLASSSSTESGRGIILGARVTGDWTRALNTYAEMEGNALLAKDALWVPVQVMLDGPYGGCSIDLGEYETGRKKGEKTRRIEFVWCLRSYGAIHWFSSLLIPIANLVAESPDLDLHISIYVTCLCNPASVPTIPNSDTGNRKILLDLTTPPRKIACCCASSSNDEEDVQCTFPRDSEACAVLAEASTKLQWAGLGGGVAVLTREASNAVAKLSLLRGVELGGVGLHTEVFSS